MCGRSIEIPTIGFRSVFAFIFLLVSMGLNLSRLDHQWRINKTAVLMQKVLVGQNLDTENRAGYLSKIMKYTADIEEQPWQSMGFVLQGDYEAARQSITRYTMLSPDTSRLVTWMAMQAYQQLQLGNYRQAEKIGALIAPQMASARYLDYPKLSQSFAGLFNNKASIHVSMQDYSRADRMYQLAILVAPQYAETFYFLGDSYRRQERLDEAIAAYRRGLELDKSTRQAGYTGLCRIYLTNDLRAEDQIEVGQECLQNGVVVWGNVLAGRGYFRKGDQGKAIEYYSTGIQSQNLSFSDSSYPLWIAYMDLGEIYETKSQYMLALRFYQCALEISPWYSEQVRALYRIGRIYSIQNDYKSSIEALERAYKLVEEKDIDYQLRVPILLAVGFSYLANKQQVEAIHVFRQVLVLEPENRIAQVQLQELAP